MGQRKPRDFLDLDEYVPPSSTLEQKLTEIWADIFELDRVGVEDDFFELGGDSLVAEGLAIALGSTFNIAFKQSQLLDINTPRKLAVLVAGLQGKAPSELPGNLTSINAEGNKTPIFLVHGNAGMAFLRPEFRAAIDPQQPIYIFHAVGFDGAAEPLGRVEDIAEAYLRMMLDVRPNGPWILGALCAGGWIAVEMVRLMEAEGIKPDKVILIDPVIQKTQKDAYRTVQLSRLTLPVPSGVLNRIADETISLVSKLYVFANTGVFIEERSPEAIRNERVRDFIVRRYLDAANQRPSAKRFVKRLLGRAPVRRDRTDVDPKLVEQSRSEHGALTRVMLKHAFRAHVVKPSDHPVIIIGNEKLNRAMTDPDFPINRTLPNRKIIVSGENHAQAVRSPVTARILQRLIDGEDPDVLARQVDQLRVDLAPAADEERQYAT
ncbi:phosphopantetheine-binding protein [Oricola sp.]|uniref:thioesterase domain-containing protein n=1 Tax=Oricola sp. TaxID=1979950 RepID=UPI0025DE6266|nr:phosphopantetheine-binding protein [Oricola sp.]MCI5077990.1 phosphopantetheine-binding protein [Oricola sp.]